LGSLTKSQTFNLDGPKLCLIRAKAQTWGKRGSQDPRVVLHNIYVQLLPLNLISTHNWYI